MTNRNQFVMVGTGAVIATAQHIPVSMMLTSEIDIYVEGPDSEAISDQIDGAIGNGSMFHRTFRYYGDGVSPTTAIMPMDWKSRATTYTIPDGTVSASVQVRTMLLSPSYARHAKRIVIWLREALSSGLVKADQMRTLIQRGLPAKAPDEKALLTLLANLVPR